MIGKMNHKLNIEITIIIFCHNEGALLEESIKSVDVNIKLAQKEFKHFLYERILVVDAPDEQTDFYAKINQNKFDKIVYVSTNDLGLNRNIGTNLAKYKIISYLDADDIWGIGWLAKGIKKLIKQDSAVVHPEFNFYFEGEPRIMISKNSSNFLNFADLNKENLWTSGIITYKNILQEHKFKRRHELKSGDFEDWEWNRRTLEKNIKHLIAINTFYFIRQRKNSLTRSDRLGKYEQ